MFSWNNYSYYVPILRHGERATNLFPVIKCMGSVEESIFYACRNSPCLHNKYLNLHPGKIFLPEFSTYSPSGLKMDSVSRMTHYFVVLSQLFAVDIFVFHYLYRRVSPESYIYWKKETQILIDNSQASVSVFGCSFSVFRLWSSAEQSDSSWCVFSTSDAYIQLDVSGELLSAKPTLCCWKTVTESSGSVHLSSHTVAAWETWRVSNSKDQW